MDGSVIAFKSSYIAKIIDYGRCYYDYRIDPAKKTQYDIESESKEVYDTVCKLPECEPNCGYKVGFSNFEPGFDLSSQRSNISQDLRLLHMLVASSYFGFNYKKMCSNVKTHNHLLLTLCNKVQFDDKYSTSENVTSGYPAKINNIVDAFLSLKDLVQNPFFVGQNVSDYNGLKKLGEMHLYEDRPLKFVPTV
jgi:hypothetical protein